MKSHPELRAKGLELRDRLFVRRLDEQTNNAYPARYAALLAIGTLEPVDA
jgi:hypothetical protein